MFNLGRLQSCLENNVWDSSLTDVFSFFFFLCVCSFSTGVAPNTSLGMIGQWFTGEAVITGTLTGLDIQLHSIHTSCLTKSLCLYLQFLNLNIWNTRGKAPKPVFFFSIFFFLFFFFFQYFGASLDNSPCGRKLFWRHWAGLRPNISLSSHANSTAVSLF